MTFSLNPRSIIQEQKQLTFYSFELNNESEKTRYRQLSETTFSISYTLAAKIKSVKTEKGKLVSLTMCKVFVSVYSEEEMVF